MHTSIYETILDETIDESTAAANVSVAGFRRFSLLGRFDGEPYTTVRMEINHDQKLVVQEWITLNEAGWHNFAQEYTTFGPDIGVVLYHPSSPMTVAMSLYAGH